MTKKGKKIHYLYKTTCIVNNKFYIGIHSTNNIHDGYLGSGLHLTRSVEKYGKENHIVEILEYFDNREELSLKEREVVNEELIKDPQCMNISIGGGNPILYGEANGFYGKVRTAEHKKAMRDALDEKLKDPEFVKRMKEKASKSLKETFSRITPSFTGKKHTEETKIKIGLVTSKAQKGEGNSQFGTCWITNGVDNKKHKKGEVLPEGWRLGRVITYN
jgi:group I intron endonuclease